MNPISAHLTTGTLGELLVQLRLLQFDVQAAPPLKDSGNDLIAIRGEDIRAIQIKTTSADHFEIDRRSLPQLYHALALVHLAGEERTLFLDQSRIFLLPREDVGKGYYTFDELAQYELHEQSVDRLFPSGSRNSALTVAEQRLPAVQENP
jgi:hypothetical protein